MIRTRWSLTTVMISLAAAPTFAQSVISAHAGLIHYVEGRAFLDGRPVGSAGAGQFPQMNDSQELRTEDGRAEVLLNPGVFLRVAENSSFRMTDRRLANTQLEFLSGAILIEAAGLSADSGVTIVYKSAAISLLKDGLYRLEAEPAQLRVLAGRASVEWQGKRTAVNKGQYLAFSGTMRARKAGRSKSDSLDGWSSRRAEQLALVNVYAATFIGTSPGARWSNCAFRSSCCCWCWNRYFGMYTFVPLNRRYRSPYGYDFWNPDLVHVAYEPTERTKSTSSATSDPSFDADRGYTVVSPTSSGNSGILAREEPAAGASSSSSSPSAPSSPSQPIQRDAGDAGGRKR